jgi:hypothetical protein
MKTGWNWGRPIRDMTISQQKGQGRFSHWGENLYFLGLGQFQSVDERAVLYLSGIYGREHVDAHASPLDYAHHTAHNPHHRRQRQNRFRSV